MELKYSSEQDRAEEGKEMRGPGLGSQHPHDGSEPPQLQDIQCPLPTSMGIMCTHVVYIHTRRQNTETHKGRRLVQPKCPVAQGG